jgi:hypothetical protein
MVMAQITKAVSLVRSGNLAATLDNRRRVSKGLEVRLLSNPMPGASGHSARRINALYHGMPVAGRYLEIGLRFGGTFQQIEVPVRVGVDPNPRFDLTKLPPRTFVSPVTSDDYFATTGTEPSFDLVFLDGLHEYRQTYTDLVNALKVCPAGVILIDDVVPSDEVSAMVDQHESLAERTRRGLPGSHWHGDVFKVLLAIRDHHPELCVRTLIGSGNPQTMVWRREVGSVCDAGDEAALAALQDVTYADVFADGPPDYFSPAPEADAIRDALRDVSGRFAA